MTFGTGIPLRQHCPFLRKNSEWAARIIDAVERNSVIEGLPKFDAAMKQRFLKRLKG